MGGLSCSCGRRISAPRIHIRETVNLGEDDDDDGFHERREPHEKPVNATTSSHRETRTDFDAGSVRWRAVLSLGARRPPPSVSKKIVVHEFSFQFESWSFHVTRWKFNAARLLRNSASYRRWNSMFYISDFRNLAARLPPGYPIGCNTEHKNSTRNDKCKISNRIINMKSFLTRVRYLSCPGITFHCLWKD